MDSSSDLLMQAIYENDIDFVKYCLKGGNNFAHCLINTNV